MTDSQRDLARVSAAIEAGGWVRRGTDPSGHYSYIDPACPAELRRLYAKLVSIGYARDEL